MNVRKAIDYSAMFATLDTVITADLPQMELYREIGRIVSSRPEKGAAVAAAEYLSVAHPDASGFSPRNLRRMREFYRTYENAHEVMAEAMSIGWTLNVVILEAELTLPERLWYIRAAEQFGWSKLELMLQIADKAHLENALDFNEDICYTEKNAVTEEAPVHAAAKDTQCRRTGNADPGNRLSTLLRLLRQEFLHRGIYSEPLLVRRRRGRPLGVAHGTGPPRRGGLRQAV